MRFKGILGCTGFMMTILGMSSLDSNEPGYYIAIGLCVVGFIFMLSCIEKEVADETNCN